MHAVTLFGNLNAINVVAQTEAFPRGEVNGAPFRVFWDQTTDFQLCPGEKVLVSATILARPMSSNATPPVMLGNEQWSAMLPIKVAVKSCPSPPNRTIMDSDRQILVEGNAGIEVLGPSTWTTQRPATDSAFVEASVHITACPVRCCYPPLPHLTYFRQVEAGGGGTGLAQQTFIRPRGARSLRAFKTGSLPAGITTLEFWAGSPSLPGVMVGTQTAITAVDSLIENFGAISVIRFTPAATAPGPILMAWEVEG